MGIDHLKDTLRKPDADTASHVKALTATRGLKTHLIADHQVPADKVGLASDRDADELHRDLHDLNGEDPASYRPGSIKARWLALEVKRDVSDEDRDDNGRWSGGGGDHEQVAKAIKSVADTHKDRPELAPAVEHLRSAAASVREARGEGQTGNHGNAQAAALHAGNELMRAGDAAADTGEDPKREFAFYGSGHAQALAGAADHLRERTDSLANGHRLAWLRDFTTANPPDRPAQTFTISSKKTTDLRPGDRMVNPATGSQHTVERLIPATDRPDRSGMQSLSGDRFPWRNITFTDGHSIQAHVDEHHDVAESKTLEDKGYSEDEERDDHGRWSGGGSSGGVTGTAGGKPLKEDWSERGSQDRGEKLRATGPKGEIMAVSAVRGPADPDWKSKTSFGASQIAGGWKTTGYHWSAVGNLGGKTSSGDAASVEEAKRAAEAAVGAGRKDAEVAPAAPAADRTGEGTVEATRDVIASHAQRIMAMPADGVHNVTANGRVTVTKSGGSYRVDPGGTTHTSVSDAVRAAYSRARHSDFESKEDVKVSNLETKFNQNHDDHGRFATAGDDASGSGSHGDKGTTARDHVAAVARDVGHTLQAARREARTERVAELVHRDNGSATHEHLINQHGKDARETMLKSKEEADSEHGKEHGIIGTLLAAAKEPIKELSKNIGEEALEPLKRGNAPQAV